MIFPPPPFFYLSHRVISLSLLFPLKSVDCYWWFFHVWSVCFFLIVMDPALTAQRALERIESSSSQGSDPRKDKDEDDLVEIPLLLISPSCFLRAVRHVLRNEYVQPSFLTFFNPTVRLWTASLMIIHPISLFIVIFFSLSFIVALFLLSFGIRIGNFSSAASWKRAKFSYIRSSID